MSRLCRYAGGLACLVTVLALAACGAGPGSTTQADAKVIGNIAFQQGETIRRIPLVDKFTGKDLTYTATSDKPSVATATVDNDADILTVTAVGAGTATITVTAKNPKGEAKQSFTVTVPTAPMEIPDFPSLEEDATRTIRLGNKFSGENLTYGASSSNERVATATVDNTADTLAVTAVGPGTATITVTATAQGSAPQTQTFTVTVPQPASEEEAPTVRTGAITSVDVAQGGAQTVTLSTVFDGANLSYAVSSSATAVATASESNGALTIRGVSIGSATVTVTATNTAGSSPAHAIAVTVAAPVTTTPETPTTTNPSTCTSPLTIKRGGIAKCKVPSKATLETPPGGGVTAIRSSNDDEPDVWIIRAHSKGTYTVTIRSGGATPAKTGAITVVVPNSPPSRNTIPPPAPGDPIPITEPAPYSVGSLNLGQYFSDDDGEDDIIRYSIGTWPDAILIDSKDGFAKTGDPLGNTLTFDALEKVTEDFQVTVYAHDDRDKSLDSVVLTFTPPVIGLVPRPGTYSVTQTETGKLTDAPTVGARIGVPHTLVFKNGGAPTVRTGFQFPRSKVKDLTDDKKLSGAVSLITQDVTEGGLYYLRGGKYYKDGENAGASKAPYLDWKRATENPPTDGTEVATDLYILKSTGVVEAKWHTTPNLDLDPQVTFELTGKGRGTITVEYHVWAGSPDSNGDAPTDGAGNSRVHASSGGLSLNIKSCNSPPDLISDCPLMTP